MEDLSKLLHPMTKAELADSRGRCLAQLAKGYGTPLYVMDEDQVRHACRRLPGGHGAEFWPRAAMCPMPARRCASRRCIPS